MWINALILIGGLIVAVFTGLNSGVDLFFAAALVIVGALNVLAGLILLFGAVPKTGARQVCLAMMIVGSVMLASGLPWLRYIFSHASWSN